MFDDSAYTEGYDLRLVGAGGGIHVILELLLEIGCVWASASKGFEGPNAIELSVDVLALHEMDALVRGCQVLLAQIRVKDLLGRGSRNPQVIQA